MTRQQDIPEIENLLEVGEVRVVSITVLAVQMMTGISNSLPSFFIFLHEITKVCWF